MAIILHYFAEFGSFRGQLRKSGWLAINSFSPDKCRTPTKHDGRTVLFEVAELLVGLHTVSVTAGVPRWLNRSLHVLISVHVSWFYERSTCVCGTTANRWNHSADDSIANPSKHCGTDSGGEVTDVVHTTHYWVLTNAKHPHHRYHHHQQQQQQLQRIKLSIVSTDAYI